MNLFIHNRRTASLQENGEKRAVLIETGLRDKDRLQVFLVRSLQSVGRVEWEVENMSPEEVSAYIERLDKAPES